MLGTDLELHPAFEDSAPLYPSEVTALVPLVGAMAGYISLHGSREQCRDFTARLVGTEPDEIGSDDDIRDAVGEIANMIAGNVKAVLSERGPVEIGVPTVVITDKTSVRVQARWGLVLPCEDYTGTFHLEIALSDR